MHQLNINMHLRHHLLLVILPLLITLGRAATGKWNLLQHSIGVSAMHMQLLHTDHVIIYDRTDFGFSNISLPNGRCRRDPTENPAVDCTAHSVEYNVPANAVRPLTVLTNIWCSSGAVMPDGTLIQAGGSKSGDRVVRSFQPCRDCDWREIKNGLAQSRWYATSHVLPGGKQIIVGGRQQFNYEFYPKTPSSDKAYNLGFLAETNNQNIENNLYPFVFLTPEGNLFIFANNRAILFDYSSNKVVKTYPTIPGGEPRSYPSTGSAVLLPLKDNVAVEVLVCGGAPVGSFEKALQGQFMKGLNTCGRIRINDPNPQWFMETMPMGRVMSDMILLPNGQVLIINGVGSGTAGWELGRDPVFAPIIYRPNNPVGTRFEVENPSFTPRMYHSSAILLRDGRVLVGGSNPHEFYNFTGVLFPTDLTLEAFSPPYLNPSLAYLRPKIIAPVSQFAVGLGEYVPLRFTVPPGRVNGDTVIVTMVAPAFATHSFSMNQRLLVLRRLDFKAVGGSQYETRVVMPGSSNLAPSGYYMVFVVHQDIPSEGIWIKVK